MILRAESAFDCPLSGTGPDRLLMLATVFAVKLFLWSEDALQRPTSIGL